MGNEKAEFLLKLAREELTDNQILEEFHRHYLLEDLKRAKWELHTLVPCCATTAKLACEKLDAVLGGA